MKKNKIIGLLATFGCAAVVAGAGLVLPVTAKAEEIGGVTIKSTSTESPRSFVMQEGAGVRYQTDGVDNGIRFKADLTTAAYNELEKIDNESEAITVKYGMLIVPYDYVKTTDWDAETVLKGTNTVYGFDCTLDEGDDTCTCQKTHVTGVEMDTLAVSGDKATLVGSIVNILAGNENREFVGMAYIEYDSGTETTYAFADYYGNDVMNNARSMTYVAQLYLQDEKKDETHELYQNYVKPLEGKEFKYTVEHYLPTGENGAYELAKTQKDNWGKINQSVSAANIAKVYGEDYKDYATATMNNTDNALVSAPLFANGRTVLKCYYQKVETTLFKGSEEYGLLEAANSDNAGYNRQSKVELADDPDGGSNQVAKIEMTDTYTWGDGLLDMNFDSTKLETATDGNWDYLTVRMYMQADYEKGVYHTTVADEYLANEKTAIEDVTSVELFNGNHLLGRYNLDEWVYVNIPKAKLNATYYKADGTVDKSSLLLNKQPSETKEGFDKLFTDNYSGNGSSQLFNIGNIYQSKFVSDSANTKLNCHDVKITYYIDTITWGVDYMAPEIQASTEIFTAAADGTQISYTPAYSVTDDFIPPFMTAQNGAQHNCLINSSHIVYDKATGKEATKNEDGSYVLTKGSDYVLSVTASDWSVTDIPGNTVTKEFDLVYTTTKTITSFDSEADLEYVNIKNDATVSVSEKNHLDSSTWGETNKIGVAELKTSMVVGGGNDGASLFLQFSETEIQNIINAFNNNEKFSLNFTVCVNLNGQYTGSLTSGNYSAFGVLYHGGKAYMGMGSNGLVIPSNASGSWNTKDTKMLEQKWYSIKITKDLLINACGWTSDDLIRSELNGTTRFWSMGNYTVKLTDAGTPVTYYLDEISYSIA